MKAIGQVITQIPFLNKDFGIERIFADSRMLLHNTVTSLLTSIQSLAGELRGSQSTYLKRVKARDESVQQYFDDDVFMVTLKSLCTHETLFSQSSSTTSDWNAPEGELTMQQLQIIEENETMTKQRERDVLHIAKSIVELNQLFKGKLFAKQKVHNEL